MEKKEKLLRKINLKDYTNYLEKILEKKSFSLETKNLLLSMVYKIENAYQDYAKTKVEVYDKSQFLEKIINIIENYCKEIEIADYVQQENKQKNYSIDKEKGRIITLENDLAILNAILEIGEMPIFIPEEEKILQKSISYFLNLGMRINETEVIRDFNGWSWDSVIKSIPNIELNLAFQNFLYLLGHDFVVEWIENNNTLIDYLILGHEKMKKSFGEEKAKEIIELLCKLAIEMNSDKDKQEADIWRKMKKENKLELENLNNKKSYLENITKEKKKITKEIEQIDKIMNNKELLQKEYEDRNKKLPNKEKIFSIRHLVNRLEIERQEFVDKIKQYNYLIDPKGYVARKEEVAKKVEFLNKLDIDKMKERRKTLLDLCLLFLSCFQIKIAKAQTKQEILSYFYVLRYYHFLPFDEEGTLLKDIEKLQESFEKNEKLLLDKARKLDVIDEVTDDTEINERIILNLFDSKMIDLNNTIIQTRVEDGKLLVEYYDTNILENTCEVHSNKTIKLKKKTKLFI